MLVVVRLFILTNGIIRKRTAVFRRKCGAAPKQKCVHGMSNVSSVGSPVSARVRFGPCLLQILLRKLPSKVLEKFQIFLERPNEAGSQF
jgi:hypothetical protein